MNVRLSFSLVFFAATIYATGQTTLFQEDFGTTNSFTLNTTDVGSLASGSNTWLINNAYAGGNGDIVCLGFPLDFPIPSTPSQPAGITNANGNYLHVASTEAVADGILCCSFAAADGFCIDPGTHFARMNADVATTGLMDVELSFWWLCNGGVQNYGEVYYSTDAGATWALITTPIAQYRDQPVWIQQTISLPVFSGQSALRFGFRFVNNTSLQGGSDPGFAIDDILISGSTGQETLTTGVVPGSICASGSIIMVPYTAIGQFDQVNVFTAELSGQTGSFDQPTVIGSVISTTSGMITAQIPIGTPAGSAYRIRVTSTTPALIGMDNGSDITISVVPNSGSNSVLTVCSVGASFALFQYLGGSPDTGGTWTDPNNDPMSGIFDPAVNSPGCYTYTVNGGACVNATSSLCINITQASYAGADYTGPLCNTGAPVPLHPYLGAGAGIGGTWTGPGGEAFNGIYIPGVTTLGCYFYNVPGSMPCLAEQAIVCIDGLTDAPDAGVGSDVVVCTNADTYDLFEALEGTPALNGIWTDENGDVVPDGYFDVSTSPVGEFLFTYTIDAVPCPPATALVTVNVEICAGITDGQQASINLISTDGTGRAVFQASDRILSVEILNVLGQYVQPSSMHVEHNILALDLGDPAKGIHIIKATTASGVVTIRLAME